MIYVCSLKVDNADLIKGYEVITTMSELFQIIWRQETTDITINKDFAKEFFTPTGLKNFIDSAKRVNKYLRLEVEGGVPLSYEESAKELRSSRNMEDIMNYLLHHKKESLDFIHFLCDNYLNNYNDTLVAGNKLNTLHLEVIESKRQLNLERDRSRIRELMHQDVVMKLETLISRINNNHDIDINSSNMLGINVDISEYRRILYIKEITRVHYADTLLYYVLEILKTLYSTPAKFVVIEAPYAFERSKLYPSCVPYTELTYSDVAFSNIYMAGFQEGLMEDILKNTSKTEYLIVLDRSGYNVPFLRGTNVEGLVTASSLKDLNEGMSRMDRIISYKKDTLHVPHIEGFDNLSMEAKMSKYSSMEVTKELINILERGSR